MPFSSKKSLRTLIMIFCSLGFAPVAKAQFFAELSYRLWNEDCAKQNINTKKNTSATTEAVFCPTCTKSSNSKLNNHDMAEAAESAYLAGLAKHRLTQLDCTESQILELQKKPEDRKKFIDNFANKLTLLGAEKRRLIEFKKNLPFDKNGLQEYEKAKLRAHALLESLPYSQIEPIRKVIDYVVHEHELHDPSQLEGWLSKQSKEMLANALSSSLEIIDSNKKVMSSAVETSGVSLRGDAKESLAQDTDLIESFRNQNREIQDDLKGIACQVDAKYGKGAQYRDRTLLAASILGSGAALIFAKIGTAALSSSLTGAAALGSVSIRSAGILRILAAAGGTAASISQTYKSCFGQDVSIKAKGSQDPKIVVCEKNALESQSSEDCLLVATLDVIGIGALTKTTKEALNQIKTGRAEIAAIAKARQLKKAEEYSWQNYSKQFQTVTKDNILRSAEVYKDAIKAKHPHIKFMETVGYKFKISKSGELTVYVPPIETIIKNYDDIMQMHVKAGRIKPDEVMTPVRVFRMKHTDEFIDLKFGDTIPLNAEPYTQALPGDVFLDLVSAKKFIISENKIGGIYSDLHTPLEHDIGHLSGLAAYPEYGSALIRLSTTQKKVLTKDFEKILGARAEYITEHLEGVTPQNREKLQKVFSDFGVLTPAMKSGVPVKIEEVETGLKKLKDQDIISLVNTIKDKRHELVEKAGGAHRDIADKQYTLKDLANNGSRGLERKNVFLGGPDGRLDLLNLSPSKALTQEQRREVAELIAALDNTSFLKFEQVVDQSRVSKIDKNSPLHYFFCINKLIDFPAYCQ